MLFHLIDKINTRIDKIDVGSEAPKFATQLQKMRPKLRQELKTQKFTADQIDNMISVMSAGQLTLIKGLPAMTREMAQVLQKGGGEPAYRCVLAASLAYFVQPNDLLPDDLPGSYGFIDDALLLHEAAALSWDIAGNRARAEKDRKLFLYIFTAVPEDRVEQFKNAINGLATTFNLLRSLDPMVAEMTTQMLVANPLQQITQQAPAGIQQRPSPYGSQFNNYTSNYRPEYTWKSGNNMGINFPGGGGVATDGRDIFVM